MTLFRRPLSGEEQESDQKKMNFKNLMERREEYPGGYFLAVQLWSLFHRPKLGTFSPAATQLDVSK